MGTAALNNRLRTGDELAASDVNQYRSALDGDFVGRSDGVATPGQNLGNPVVPWGTVFAQNINVNGNDVDLSSLTRGRYSIVSGRTGSGNGISDFIENIDRVGRRYRILADAVNLVLIINGQRVVINQDIDFTFSFQTIRNLGINIRGLPTTAGRDESNPYYNSWNHDAFEVDYIGKNAGNKDVVYSDNVGNHYFGRIPISLATITGSSTVTDPVTNFRENYFTNERLNLFSYGNPDFPNQVDQGNREYFLARPVKIGEEYFLIDVKRRIFPIGQNYNIFKMLSSPDRQASQTVEDGNLSTINNRRGLTIHNLYWIFIDADNPLVPIIISDEPIYTTESDERRQGRQAWFNIERQEWTLSGVSQAGRRNVIPIGIVSNGYQQTNSSRLTPVIKSFDFSREYKRDNTIRLSQRSDYVFESKEESNSVSVYGNDIRLNQRLRISVEGTPRAGTCLYFYLTEQGVGAVELGIAPLYRDDLGGYYHPTKSWRCIGNHVVGNVGLFISHKYSNKERYKQEYNIRAGISGTATESSNDISINNSRDGFLLKNLFDIRRPFQANTPRPSYAWFSFGMRKNNLFREYGRIVENLDGGLYAESSGNRSFYNIRSYFERNNLKGFVSSLTSFPQRGTGHLILTINRESNDAVEKQLWNELS